MDNMKDMDMMMMQMTFYWTNDCTFLFDSWHTQSNGSFVGMLILCFLWSVLTQATSYLLRRLQSQVGSQNKIKLISDGDQNSITKDIFPIFDKNTSERLVASCGYFVNYFMLAINMLLLMTFNGWVILSITFGMSVGYFIFQSKENCYQDFVKCC